MKDCLLQIILLVLHFSTIPHPSSALNDDWDDSIRGNNNDLSYYEYDYKRNARNSVSTQVRNGGIYKIENEGDSQYLTARDGKNFPGQVITKTWLNHPNQLWEVTQLVQGYLLKPVVNEFNIVTSQVDHHAHAYNLYTFKSIGSGKWLIMNVVTLKCLASGGKGKNTTNVKCDKLNKGQQWKFHSSEKK